MWCLKRFYEGVEGLIISIQLSEMHGTGRVKEHLLVAASRYSSENIFNINDLRAILRRVSLFVLTSLVALIFMIEDTIRTFTIKYTDLCKVFLKIVQS